MSSALFSGLRSISTVPFGSLAKAASVGAKTVNGPSPCSTSTKSAAFRAAVSVLKEPFAVATSTIVLLAAFLGFMGCASTGSPRGSIGEPGIVGIGLGMLMGVGMGVGVVTGLATGVSTDRAKVGTINVPNVNRPVRVNFWSKGVVNCMDRGSKYVR